MTYVMLYSTIEPNYPVVLSNQYLCQIPGYLEVSKAPHFGQQLDKMEVIPGARGFSCHKISN